MLILQYYSKPSMVFKKLSSFIYNCISPTTRQLRIKDVTTSYEANAVDDHVLERAKDGEVISPGGGSGSYSADQGLEVEGEFCCVCLSRLKECENMRKLPCMHKFHKVCIDRWFNMCRKTCPVCRFSMRGEENSYKREEQLTEEMVIWFSSFHVAGF